MVWNWLRRHPLLADAALVLALGAGYVAAAVHQHRYGLGIVLAVLQVAPLLGRRRYPIGVLAVITAAGVVDGLVYSETAPFAALVAVYSVATQRRRAVSFVAAALSAAAFGAVALGVSGFGRALGFLILFAAAWVIGDNLGTRRAYLRELEEKADRLEREQAAEAARARAEEQARIARELHDVIAHNVSVMVVQAAAANDVFDARPDRAREALRTIEATGRGALAELRRLLGAVRETDPAFAPQPGLDDLDTLMTQVRSAGLTVALRVEGAPVRLPPALDLSAYRIVQEALTNTIKHARATRADVSLRYGSDTLDVEIRDDGAGGANGNDGGHGLVGMRERVAVFGGTLDAGPSPGGGFDVLARFPL